MADFIVECNSLFRSYYVQRGTFGKWEEIVALSNVSLSIKSGQTLAVVGESGSGKSTLSRIIGLIDAPTKGEFIFRGELVNLNSEKKIRGDLRRQIQLVFQNPFGSLNPRQMIGEALTEPLLINKVAVRSKCKSAALEMLERVGLRGDHFYRYPHMFSGGQRQRIAIARALMLKPQLVVLDEPVSALDLSVQAQVLNLLKDLQSEMGLTYLFVSHDLSVVRFIADDVIVMNRGRVVEQGSCNVVLRTPKSDYTRELLSAAPTIDLDAIASRVASRSALNREVRAPCVART